MTGRNSSAPFIAGFRQGTFTTVRELYSLHYTELCFFAQQLIHDEQEAKEIVLDTFIRLVQKRERFDSLSNIKAFLYITTRNTCLNFLRSDKNNVKKENKPAETATNPSLYMDAVAAADIQLLHNSILQLPLPMREIFRRSYQNGEYVADIATQLNMHPREVLENRSEALQRLLRVLPSHAALVMIYFLAVIYPGTKLVKVA